MTGSAVEICAPVVSQWHVCVLRQSSVSPVVQNAGDTGVPAAPQWHICALRQLTVSPVIPNANSLVSSVSGLGD